ncbi:MAG: SPOR domain-containing protein [Prevotella sp.]|nr:SPOR domain-containing protein [Prevotella sp.]
MKNFITLFIVMLSFALTAEAQKYTEQIQKRVKNQGTVTINQSDTITKLVNGDMKKKQDDNTNKEPATTKTTPITPPVTPTGVATRKETENKKKQDNDSTKKEDSSNKELPDKKKPLVEKEDNNYEAEPIVDTSKKVMLRSYKVNGFRVQAFAGGNTRNDKMQAQATGNKIKMAYPDQPIYVHFYSPRWICRVGNYKTMEEANAMLRKVRALGYKQATIVKGKITVQY